MTASNPENSALKHPPETGGPAEHDATQELSQAVLLNTDIFPATPSAHLQDGILRVASYNIHKGERGVGPTKRAEHENLALAIEGFDADLVFLQEVRKQYNDYSIAQSMRLVQPQAELIAPEGYISSYMTNAYTKKGQHGNALLSRWPVIEVSREDISNNRFEQRGLLHVKVKIDGFLLHCIVVHLSLTQTSRAWQLNKLVSMVKRDIPANAPTLIAGDFNDWSDKLLAPMQEAGFKTFPNSHAPTFPSFAPIFRLDRMYTRGIEPLRAYVPKGKIWSQMSDHLPLIGEFKIL